MGFSTTWFHVTSRNLRTGYMFFFHKTFFSPLTSWASGSDKRTHDNSSHLLIRAIWPKKTQTNKRNLFVWYCPISLPLRPRRGLHARRNLRGSCQIGKRFKYQPTRNEQRVIWGNCSAQGRERGNPDGLFHRVFWWSTTEPQWLGETEMQFGSCFIK